MDDDLLADLDDLGDEESVAGSEMSIEIKDKQYEADSLESLTETNRSKRLANSLEKVELYTCQERSNFYNSGPVEQDPEYILIVEANKLVVELEYEISQKIQELYSPRFPELETILLHSVTYAKIVKLIGNETDMTKIDLKSHLPSATVMVITVTSTTTTGRPLKEQELKLINECCDTAEEMNMKKNKLLSYVSSRMTLMAPNLSILLGSPVAAKLMGLAGGLTPLSKIPASNVLVLGAEKKTTALGLSRVTMGKHMGYIYECDLVQNAPSHIQRKAARLLSAKCALAVRVDLSRSFIDGRFGYEYRDEIQKKIALLVEPPPAKKVKALPLPIEFKKKRGGARARREKERMGASDLQKAANRMAFGEQEQEIMGTTGESIGLGLLGGNTGKLRMTKKAFKVPLSKKHKAMHMGITASDGLSSVAFTPLKGIELENPESKKNPEPEGKYFSSHVFRKPI